MATFNKQYPTLTMKYSDKVHDRFIIIDYKTNNETFYICGASSKDAGQKVCTITQLNDKENLHNMVERLLQCKDFLFLDKL